MGVRLQEGSNRGAIIRPCSCCAGIEACWKVVIRIIWVIAPPASPSVVAMTFSAIDPTLAPEGKHTLFTWAQYHSYELRNGEHWDQIREREADKLYDLVCQYAPNMKGKMIGRYIQTPLDLERDLGLLRGNVMHFEMSLDQMFMFRPLPEISCYRAPMKNLYLTGASTHPGGGVFGASGRNTAKVILGWRG